MKHTVEEVQLKNGAKGLLIDVPGTQVVRMQVKFNSGYLYSPNAKYEMPHITEHLLLGGNEDFPDSILFKAEVEKNGAYFNAYTNDQFNWYEWECADFEVKRILNLAKSQLTKPLIQTTDVETEKGRVNEELQGYLSEQYRTLHDITRQRFEAVPGYQARLDQLPSIGAADMKSYYRMTHSAQNSCFFAAGAVSGNKDVILSGFEQIFAGLPQGQALDYPKSQREKLTKPSIVKRDISQIFYNNVFFLPHTTEKQRATLSILNLILGSFLPSSLFGAVWKSGLAYGASTFYEHGKDFVEFYITNNVSPENAEALFKLIVEKLKNAATGKISARDLADAKKMMLGSAQLTFQAPRNFLNFYNDDYMLFGIKSSLQEWIKLKQSVTNRDIQVCLQEILASQYWTQSFVGPVDQAKSANLYKIMGKLR